MGKQELVKDKIEKLQERLNEIRAEETIVIAQINAWQTICTHPQTKQVCSCGELWTKCLVCGAEI